MGRAGTLGASTQRVPAQEQQRIDEVESVRSTS